MNWPPQRSRGWWKNMKPRRRNYAVLPVTSVSPQHYSRGCAARESDGLIMLVGIIPEPGQDFCILEMRS